MSHKCTNWAFGLPLRPPEKVVLLAIADYADERDIAWPSVAKLVEKCTLSRASIQRRLKMLEAMGVLVRFERYRHDGSRSSDELRLQLDVAAPAILAFYNTDGKGSEDHENEGETEAAESQETQQNMGSQTDTPPPQHSDRTASSVTRPPSHSCDPKDSSFEPPLEPKTTPKPPSSRETAEVAAPSAPSLDGLQDFKTAYDHPTTKPGQVEQIWAALNEAERKQATAGAHGYAAQRKAGKIKVVLDMARFLKDPKVWDEFAGHALALKSPSAQVHEGTEAFAAWIMFYRIRGFRELPSFLVYFDIAAGCRVLRVPTEFPPLVRAAPPFSKNIWHFIAVGDQRRAAWNSRIFEAFGEGIKFLERHRPIVDGIAGEETKGNWFPWEWPPSKAAERRAEETG